jgi:hypothetical protein
VILPKYALQLVTLDFFVVALQKFAAGRKKEKYCKCLYLINYFIIFNFQLMPSPFFQIFIPFFRIERKVQICHKHL